VILRVEHGKPLVFGKNKDKGIAFRGFKPAVVAFEPGKPPAEVAVYDETNAEMAYLLAGFTQPDFPVPLGVFRATAKPAFEELYYGQVKGLHPSGDKELEALLSGPDAWEIK